MHPLNIVLSIQAHRFGSDIFPQVVWKIIPNIHSRFCHASFYFC